MAKKTFDLDGTTIETPAPEVIVTPETEMVPGTSFVDVGNTESSVNGLNQEELQDPNGRERCVSIDDSRRDGVAFYEI